MTTIVTRAGKGSPLTHTEVDTNFTNLNTNKLEAGAIALGSAATPSISFTGDTNTGIYSPGADQVAVATNGNARLYIASDGKVGIGTTGPDYNLQVAGTNPTIAINATNSSASSVSTLLYRNVDGNGNTRNIASIEGESTSNGGYGALAFHTAFNNSLNERFRCDAEGRLLVGTSTTAAAATELLQVEGIAGNVAAGGAISLRRASVGNSDQIGIIHFKNATEGAAHASISAICDGTPAAGDFPGALLFSTTADGASSPTERMRITSGGAVLFIKQVRDYTTEGIVLAQGSTSGTDTSFVTNAGSVVTFSRGTNDGTILSLRQDGTEEGTISVSGSTISYNGAHLSRWSQLPSGAERTEILRGSVLSNIDEMCEWGEEDNEQLNRMKVSDVEGDKNVSGVFQAWDDDDDTYTNDFYCAMTGDFIIRIAAGITIERGDLLMSAGDGTAKPQDDDIIRSKTIAKVTSTNVTCTYDDGSYCVPCVLMAC